MTISRSVRYNFVLYCTFGVLLGSFIGGCALVLGDLNKGEGPRDWSGLATALVIILLFNIAYAGLALSVVPGQKSSMRGLVLMLLGLAYPVTAVLMFNRVPELDMWDHPFIIILILLKAVAAIAYGYGHTAGERTPSGRP